MTAADISSMIKDFGWPGAILILLAIGAWRVWVKIVPILERMGSAWVTRQQEMAVHSKTLADKTVELADKTMEIQTSNQKAIEALPVVLQDMLQRLLRDKFPDAK